MNGSTAIASDAVICNETFRIVCTRCGSVLYRLPRLRIGQVFIPQAGDVHRLFERFAETVILDILFERLF